MLSLYLLLLGKPYLSALTSGVGFMIKLIPLILLPIGAKLIPQKSTWGRLRIPAWQIDFDLQGLIIYCFIFIGTVITIAFPFYRLNPRLILAPFQITGARTPWETIWALLEGNYTYGIIPLDMRDLAWTPAGSPASRLPWLWITLIFALVYAFLYTRPIDWHSPKRITAFTGLTICLFFLYSKGYSPQWLGWLLVFSSLLLPNLAGLLYALILSGVNILEANFFFIMFPQEHWLLTTMVLIRTGLIIVLALEFCLLIWPQLETARLIKGRQYALTIGLILLLLGLFPATNRLYRAYFETRLGQSPYHNTISWLREQPVTEAILLNDHATYDWFYPYLRHSHAFFMLDDYADATTTVEAKTAQLFETIAARHQALWIYDSDPAKTTLAEATAFQYLAESQLAHQADTDGGRLYLYIFNKGP